MKTAEIIRGNLHAFGMEDMTVIGVLHASIYEYDEIEEAGIFRKGEEIGRIELLLSDLCDLRRDGLAKRVGIAESLDLLSYILVERDSKLVGHVDCDGDFDYEAAPDFRTALGWKIATDGGRVRVLEGFNLDEAATLLLNTIRVLGTSKETFFGSYRKALKSVFVCDYTSRFGDGYCGAMTTLWRVATRELFGEEHAGYPFEY